MKHKDGALIRAGMLLLSVLLFAALVWGIWRYVPRTAVRIGLLALCERMGS